MCSELRANPNRMAKGVIIEAKLDKAPRSAWRPCFCRTVPCTWATISWPVLASGRVRAMVNDKGERVTVGRPLHACGDFRLYGCAQCG